MRFGHFDDERREYVITRPDTPLPWINYLGSEDYFALVSNTAGGYSFFRDARLRRLIRYRYNNAPLDVGGRFLYLRDDDTGDYWNPGWQPTQRDLDDYTCRHGLGYTVITGARGGIRAETTVPRAARGDARGLADARDQRAARHRPAVGDRRGGVLPLGRPGRCHELPAQPVDRRGPRRGRRRLPRDGVPRAPRPLRVVREPGAGRPASRRRARPSSGPYRGWDRPVAVETRHDGRLRRPWLAAGRGAPDRRWCSDRASRAM